MGKEAEKGTREEGLDPRDTWRGESAGCGGRLTGDWTGNAQRKA